MEGMGDQEDRRAVSQQPLEALEGPGLEALVTDRHDLVDDHDVGTTPGRDGEPQARDHARRIAADRDVEEVAQLRPLGDLGRVAAHVPRIVAEDRPVQHEVLEAGQVGVEAGAQLDHRGDPSADDDPAGGRREDSRDDLHQRALACTVGPDHSEDLPGIQMEGDIAKRPEVLVLDLALCHADRELLDARRPVAGEPIDDRDVPHVDSRPPGGQIITTAVRQLRAKSQPPSASATRPLPKAQTQVSHDGRTPS